MSDLLVVSLRLDSGPCRWTQIFGIVWCKGTKPYRWVANDFVLVVVEIGGPPTEGTVGDDVVTAIAHKQQLFPIR